MTATTAPARFEAKQDRSKRSQDRLIQAAEEIAIESGFEAMSIREVCQRAGLTSGAFYARFNKKMDLALVLAEKLGQECFDLAGKFAKNLPKHGLPRAFRALLSDSIALYRSRGALLRAIIAVARTYPEVAQSLRQTNGRIFAELLKSLEPCLQLCGHPRPELAARLGLVCVLNALRELVLEQQLFEEKAAFKDSQLVKELSAMFLKYVEFDPAEKSP